jgi:hypothetical protein
VATQAANWSFYRGEFLGRIMFFPRVIADKDVRPSDYESCNMVLFGTKETNLVIDKYKDRLPVHLNAAATSDHGLLYIYPIDGHYITVSSGLPWWNASQEQNYRFPPAYAEVPNLKDYVLFKGSLKTPVTEGYFDQNWKPNDEELKKINAAGN